MRRTDDVRAFDGGAFDGGAFDVRAALAGVLLVGWLAWPVLAYGGVIVAAPFFGEQPTAAEERASTLYLVAAAVVAFGLPLLAWALAPGRRWVRRVAVVELLTPVLVLVLLALG